MMRTFSASILVASALLIQAVPIPVMAVPQARDRSVSQISVEHAGHQQLKRTVMRKEELASDVPDEKRDVNVAIVPEKKEKRRIELVPPGGERPRTLHRSDEGFGGMATAGKELILEEELESRAYAA